MTPAHVFQHNYTGLQLFVYHCKDEQSARLKFAFAHIDGNDWNYIGTKVANDATPMIQASNQVELITDNSFFNRLKEFMINISNQQTRLTKLITTDRYLSSKYEIVQLTICGLKYWAIKDKKSYVDLSNTSHSWEPKDDYFNSCLGSLRKVLNAFDRLEPECKNISQCIVEIHGE